MLYVIGDVHGMLDELKVLHGLIMRHSNKFDEPHQIIMLGDYIDRGPDSKGVLDFLMSEPFTGFKHVFLRGNHEQMLVDASEGYNVNMFLANGGIQTIDSFGGICYIDDQVYEPYKKWIKTLPHHYIHGNFIFVHAGLDPRKLFRDNTNEDKMWIRDVFLKSDDVFKYKGESMTVIHGHTPTFYDPHTKDKNTPVPVVKPNRINLDTGSVFTKTLTCLIIKDNVAYGFLSNKKRKK